MCTLNNILFIILLLGHYSLIIRFSSTLYIFLTINLKMVNYCNYYHGLQPSLYSLYHRFWDPFCQGRLHRNLYFWDPFSQERLHRNLYFWDPFCRGRLHRKRYLWDPFCRGRLHRELYFWEPLQIPSLLRKKALSWMDFFAVVFQPSGTQHSVVLIPNCSYLHLNNLDNIIPGIYNNRYYND